MKFLIVDDDTQILDTLAVGFRLQWPDAAMLTATTCSAALFLFDEHNPDLVMLDINLPDGSGFDILRQIRQVSDAPVIIITARGEELDQVKGLEMGADDYIVKPFGHMSLIARIKAVMRRTDVPALLRTAPDFTCGDLAIHFGNRQVSFRGQPVKLTPLEYRLLYHLVRNAGRFMCHEYLIKQVWGPDYGATTDHLKVYISRLRAKIEFEDNISFIETERGLGYRFALGDASCRESAPCARSETH